MHSPLELFRNEMMNIGYFCPSIEQMDGWKRASVCTKRRSDGRGFCGNSMFVTFLNGGFVIGNWLGHLYLSASRDKMIMFVKEWFSIYPDKTQHCFDSDMLQRHEMTLISDAEFTRLIQRNQE